MKSKTCRETRYSFFTRNYYTCGAYATSRRVTKRGKKKIWKYLCGSCCCTFDNIKAARRIHG